MRPMQRADSVHASMRRAGEQARAERAARSQADIADARAAEVARVRLTADDLAGARFIRTRHGWHQVIRVNRVTVKIAAAPGMDDQVPVGRVLEVRR